MIVGGSLGVIREFLRDLWGTQYLLSETLSETLFMCTLLAVIYQCYSNMHSFRGRGTTIYISIRVSMVGVTLRDTLRDTLLEYVLVIC